MAYANDLLSHVPADWSTDKASLTDSAMNISAGGNLYYTINAADLASLPESLLLSIVSDSIEWSVSCKIEIVVAYLDKTYIAYTVPVWGIVSVELDLNVKDFSSVLFKVSATTDIVLRDFALLAPASDDFTEVIDGGMQGYVLLFGYYKPSIVFTNAPQLTQLLRLSTVLSIPLRMIDICYQQDTRMILMLDKESIIWNLHSQRLL